MTDFDKHHRRSVRLKEYDYAQNGAYFVTICTHQRACVFGEIVDDVMRLSPAGEIVREEWLRTAVVRPYVELDAFVVMPNHIHGILIIFGVPATKNDKTTGANVGATRRVAPTETTHPNGPKTGSLGAILGQFKSIVTKRTNQMWAVESTPVWQRNYYDHVIRNEAELNRYRGYIESNPARWSIDAEHIPADEL